MHAHTFPSCLAPLTVAALAAPAPAQQSPFQSPGMVQLPSASAGAAASEGAGQEGAEATGTGQTDRFSSVFNPAFSFVVDVVVDSVDSDDEFAEDGVDLDLRIVEFGAQSWVDPNAWAYFVAASDGESVELEEAAVHYTGLGSTTTIRAGRFFVDFGKQMQTHVHELRTLERPLVLRTYLGDEIAGDGLQYDGWTGVGDTTVVRWSLGVFADLLAESDPQAGVPQVFVAERKDLNDLNFTARLTGLTDVGTNGQLQVGASGRVIPEASAELNGIETTNLESSVLGLDVTYGWTSDDTLRALTLGGEFLANTGDTVAQVDDGGTPADPSDDVLSGFDDPSQTGWYAFFDFAWNHRHSVGVQYSLVELPEEGAPESSEIEVYYTRMFSEFHRLRLVVASFDTQVADGDALRVAIQYTAAVGAHGHGLNW
jgi:hypothetical protein